MRILAGLSLLFLCLIDTAPAQAQEIRIATVNRPPFSMVVEGAETGFTMELLDALMTDIGRKYTTIRAESFGAMLELVRNGSADAAAANISITAEREQLLDFTQPMFNSGLQIMTHQDYSSRSSLSRAILSPDFVIAVLAAFGILLGAGMLMWRFEHGRQEYFDRPAGKSAFPAFWWALNLVVNGGFEERVPRSAAGRIFGVVLVVSSLFFVSVFVARITAIMTIDAIHSSVDSINDLDGRRIGTIAGSTADDFLTTRDLNPIGFAGLESLLLEFEERRLDAVVFDAPVLAYYISENPQENAELIGAVLLPESYGIALPSGSDLAEPLNQSLLKLREDGTYSRIYREWFGRNPGSG